MIDMLTFKDTVTPTYDKIATIEDQIINDLTTDFSNM